MSGHGINLQQDITRLSKEERARLYRGVRAVRLSMQKQTDDVKSFETRLEESLVNEMETDQGIVVDGYSFVVTSKPKPIVKDWEKFFALVRQLDRFDLLQKRVSDKAVMDMENWHLLPGVERFNAKSLSVTKR